MDDNSDIRGMTRRPKRPLVRERSIRILVGVFLVLLVIVTTGAVAVFTGAISFAQQEAPIPPANPGSKAAATPAALSSSAKATAAQQQQMKVVKTEPYQDWIYTCVENQADKAVRCSIAQELSDSKSKQFIFLWRIIQDGKGGLIGVWQTPQGLLLPRGITLDAGTPKPITIPFQTCVGGRCEAVANLAADFQEALVRSDKAMVTLVGRNGHAINLPISVRGLSEGIAALKQNGPPG